MLALAAAGLAVTVLVRRGSPESVRRDGPQVRPLAVEAGSEGHPSLSPDGLEVVYHWLGAGGLVIKPSEGGATRLLTHTPAGHFDGYPTWSPRGDAIAFLRQEGWQPKKRDLFVVSPLTGQERRLTQVGGLGLAWTPDGESLAFIDSDSAGEPHSIFVVSVQTGVRKRLTNPPLGSFGDLFCAFSPDGKTLAFTRWPTLYAGDVWIMPATGGEPRGITHDASVHEGLDWTPDGKSVVFSSRLGGTLGLWKVRATGLNEAPTPVPETMGGAKFPSFSRSGAGKPAKLVYECQSRDVNIWKWTAAASGEGAVSQIVASTWYDDHPAISPDGQRIAFTSNRTGHNEIWTANADGARPTRVTHHEGMRVLAPRWSPDSRSIAFASDAEGNRDIYVVGADGSGSRRLTTEPSDEGNPSWSRDGGWIYFRSDRNGVPQIWKSPSSGGQAVQVTTGEGSQAFEAPDGKRVYFVRSRDLPGVWSVPLGGGRETFVVPDAKEGFWEVADPGIYFLTTGSQGVEERWALEVFRFESRTRLRMALLPASTAGPLHIGFAAARDGQSILWTQMDKDSDDILLLEPWRNDAP